MIQEQQQFILYTKFNDQNQYQYTLDNNFNPQVYNSIAVNQITFPRSLYQIATDFDITLDGNVIHFYKGNITFQQLIQKCNVNHVVCAELHLVDYQKTGKLKLSRDDSAAFVIVIPAANLPFFGYLDASGNNFISDQICQLNLSKNILISCDACVNQLKFADKNFNVIQQFTMDQTQNTSFFEKEFDILQNRKRFALKKEINIQFLDDNLDDIFFESTDYFFIQFTLFNYNANVFLEIQLYSRKLAEMYAMKNYKKQLGYKSGEETPH